MPFTPLHMGPALAIKAVAGRRFSITAFGLTQVLMDIEPLVRIVRGDAVLHGATHTYLGSLVVAAIAVPVCAWLCPRIVRGWNGLVRSHDRKWLVERDAIAPSALVAGIVIGALSHVAIDSIMHADMHPYAPFAQASPLLGTVSIDTLHVLCFASGFVGALAWVVARRYRSRGDDPTR
jgi:hypothetical protein